MGMTIDDVILCLKGIKQYGSDTFTKQSQGDWQNSLDTAIETMRKYQKIKDVVADFNNQYNHRTPLDLMCEVKEVVEDGSDTNS